MNARASGRHRAVQLCICSRTSPSHTAPLSRFSDEEMRSWYELDYLPKDLKIRFGDKGAMMELERLFPKSAGVSFEKPTAADLADALAMLQRWS